MILVLHFVLLLAYSIARPVRIHRFNTICSDMLKGSDTEFMNLQLEEQPWFLDMDAESCLELQDIIRSYPNNHPVSKETPACSLDDNDSEQGLRRKRFVSNPPRYWSFTDLRWKLQDPHDLFKQDADFDVVRNTISHALWMWSRASHRSLKFTDLTNSNQTADLDIYFARWNHGDYEPFDGRGGIVAHSGYPMHGRVHFDASELWTIKGMKGVDLRYVTLHELGHALGLRHSSKPNAIMHPIYKRSSGDIYLSEDDINGIRQLYSQANPRTNPHTISELDIVAETEEEHSHVADHHAFE